MMRDNLWLGLMSNMINRIKSLYTSVKSRVKYEMIHVCLESDKANVYLPFIFQCF